MQIKEPLTFSNVFKYVSDYDIFRYYCPDFKEIGVKFKTPFRKEKQASAVVYSTPTGHLRFNDFVLPTMSSVEFVKEMYNITLGEALNKIVLDFKIKEIFAVDWGGNTPSPSKAPILYNKTVTKATDTIIQVRYKPWSDADIQFWNQYGIGLSTLTLFDVHPIDYFWINDSRFRADKYAYSYNYYWYKDIYRRKIYQPYNQNGKWFANGGFNIVQGKPVLPKSGELLIITKALKDVMCLYELGYTAIAPSSEKTMPNTNYINKQKKRFQKLVLFLDNDTTGKEASIKHSEHLGIPYILIPDEYGVKDISDFYKKYGKETSIGLLHKLLQNVHTRTIN